MLEEFTYDEDEGLHAEWLMHCRHPVTKIIEKVEQDAIIDDRHSIRDPSSILSIG